MKIQAATSHCAMQQDSRHLVAQCTSSGNQPPTGVAYMCYRWEEDPPEEDREDDEETLPVAYLYELQLEPSAQGKGLGSCMMGMLERWVRY